MSATVETPRPAPPAPPSADISNSATKAKRRRRVVRIVVLLVVVAGAVAFGVFILRSRSNAAGSSAPPTTAPATATVATKNITNDASFDGTVAHTAANPLLAGASGRITALAPTGATIANGQPLFSVDGNPVVMMLGAIPAWRTMDATTTAGPDVTQLQTDLKSLGFDPDNLIVPGSAYDAATANAVVRWQQQLGVTATGTVPLGSVIFQPATITIGVQHVTPGSPVNEGTAVADASVPAISMQFTLPSDAKTTIAIGQTVDVTLPDRSSGKGTIQSIGTAVDATTGNTSTVGRGTVDPPRNAAAVTDGAAIKVRVSQVVAQNVLTVPATALTNHLDGTFTVTVVKPGGGNETVPVKVGASSNGVVEVTGASLAPGTKVLIPT